MLARAANVAQILSFFVGAYCAYGTWVVLHPASATSGLSRLMADHPIVLYMAFGAFLALLAVGITLRIFSSRPKPDSKIAEPLQSASKLVIHSAVWGAGSISCDVANIVRERASGDLVMPVETGLLGEPAWGKFKYLRVKYSYGDQSVREIVRPEHSILVLPEDPWSARLGVPVLDLPDVMQLAPYPHMVLVDLPQYAPISPLGKSSHEDKVFLTVQNKWDREVDVWTPFWVSNEVNAQVPFAVKFRREIDGTWEQEEHPCITLGSYQKALVWIGLTQPNIGDGLQVRLARQNTGHLIFPVKSGGKMRYTDLGI